MEQETTKQTLTSKEPTPREGPYKVFVVSPIGSPGSDSHKKASYALTYIIRKALYAPEWLVERADEGDSPDSIGHHVVKKINEADLVIADLTDLNPNVFYELAIAHGWHKPVIHIMQEGQRPPFDVADMRTIFYDLSDAKSVDDAIHAVKRSAQHVMKSDENQATPLTQFAAFNNALADPDPKSAQALVFDELSQRLNRIERLIRHRQEPSRRTERDPWRPPHLSEVEKFQEAAERFATLYPNGHGESEEDQIFFDQITRLRVMWEQFDSRGRALVRNYLDSNEIPFPEIVDLLS